MSASVDTVPQVKLICAAFVERATQLEYKGKKRDHAALDFVAGAATAAQIAGNDALAAHLTRMAFIVAVRGYAEVAYMSTVPND